MGTVVARKRKDGTTAYMAKIIIKREGRVVHRESKTHPRRATAQTWMIQREAELAKPGAIGGNVDATLDDAIDRYIKADPGIGRTKAQVLKTLRTLPIAKAKASRIVSADLVDLATFLGRDKQPQTVGNYMSHLQAVFAIADDAWSIPLDEAQMVKALKACRRLGLVDKSRQRDRRPTIAELDRLMTHFVEVQRKRPATMPMPKLIAFALFSTRRQEEITRLARRDYEGDRVLVRDMKHPGQKVGNDVWCTIVPEAQRIADSMPVVELLFPFEATSVSAAFTRACQFLEIEDLHFHDLRHEGISRLFEMGWTIPQVSQVSGHRSWKSMQRYTHMRQTGDKYAGWEWLDRVAPPG